MTILSSEIKTYRSAIVNDTINNGGSLSDISEPDGLSNSLWPDISEVQRINGIVQYRKVFIKIDNASDFGLGNVRVGLMTPTAGEDIMVLYAGTETDTQSTVVTTNAYGAGTLDVSVNAAATSIAVLVEDGDVILFRNGDLIRISNKETLDGEGYEEFVRVLGTPSIAGDVVTISLATPLSNSYTADVTWVSSLIELDGIASFIDNKVVSSSAGTFNEASVTAHHVGAISDTITCTFSSAIAFTAVSAVAGSLGVGNINSSFSPINTSFSTPYFTIPVAAWGGTWASGNSVVFKTHPAAKAIWMKRDAPALSTRLAAQWVTLMIFAEAA